MSFCAGKGDRRRCVEWLPIVKLEQVRLALLLLASSRRYKALLTKENLQGFYRHPDKFIHASLPRLWTFSCNFDSRVHKVYKNIDGVLGGTEEAQEPRVALASSRKRPTPVKKKVRKDEKRLEVDRGMRKKLVLKPIIIDFDFDNEGRVLVSSAGSRQEGASKRVRHLIPTVGGGGVVSMAKVSPSVPVDAVPMFVVRQGSAGPSAPSGVTTARGLVSLPRGFLQINALSPDAVLLLFNRDVDKR